MLAIFFIIAPAHMHTPCTSFRALQVLVGAARRSLLEGRLSRGPGAQVPTRRLASIIAARVHAGTASAGRRPFAAHVLLLGATAGTATTGTNAGARGRSAATASTRATIPGPASATISTTAVAATASPARRSPQAVSLFEVTPLGQVRSVRALAVGAGAGAGCAALQRLLPARDKGAGGAGICHCDTSGGGGKSGAEGGSDGDAALEAALEALLASRLPSARARDALAHRGKSVGVDGGDDGNAHTRTASSTATRATMMAAAPEDEALAEVRLALARMAGAAEAGEVQALCVDNRQHSDETEGNHDDSFGGGARGTPLTSEGGVGDGLALRRVSQGGIRVQPLPPRTVAKAVQALARRF